MNITSSFIAYRVFMLDVLKEMILDFQELVLKTGVPRDLELQSVQRKATICVGVRRSGKSTFMLQVIEGLLNEGVSRQNILHLNFFDDRLHFLQHPGSDEHQSLGTVIEAYYALYPEKKNTEKIYCFFDEIQVIKGWKSFIDRIMRTENCEVYVTGSSSQMLSSEISTQMRGRSISWEMFPFSFAEFLKSRNIETNDKLSTKKRLLVQKAFNDFWATGGFPEVTELDRRLRINIHQEYFNSILFRDIIERHDAAHPKAITDLAHKLINNVASLYSINRLTGYLKSLGHQAPKSAVARYLDWFEDAYFLFKVRIFDASLARSNTNPKKIYCIDHSLVRSVGSGILINSGHLLENLVFTALRRVSSSIFYYKSKNGREVDFVVQNQDGSRMLVQVCESIANAQTLQRERVALEDAMTDLKLKHGCIVTRDEDAKITCPSGTIEVIPAWKFLLQIESNSG